MLAKKMQDALNDQMNAEIFFRLSLHVDGGVREEI